MEDRGAIQAMKKLGYSNRAIARYLHCAPSTISNERKRGTPLRTGSRGRARGYSAKRGDAVYKENRKNSHKPHRIDKCTSFVQWVITQVRKEKWSITIEFNPTSIAASASCGLVWYQQERFSGCAGF